MGWGGGGGVRGRLKFFSRVCVEESQIGRRLDSERAARRQGWETPSLYGRGGGGGPMKVEKIFSTLYPIFESRFPLGGIASIVASDFDSAPSREALRFWTPDASNGHKVLNEFLEVWGAERWVAAWLFPLKFLYYLPVAGSLATSSPHVPVSVSGGSSIPAQTSAMGRREPGIKIQILRSTMLAWLGPNRTGNFVIIWSWPFSPPQLSAGRG
ncbi:hypothetical protein B0H19DRAFT_1079896 [Mycena capillaripes]|nr:hypothetical protein B0H19DRAFT_1079896 [Mycena capillaripes]